jgi:RNA polymerase sigma-70 factor, ECF subfamily
MIFMPGGGIAGRRGARTGWDMMTSRKGSATLFPAPAEALAEGDPVGKQPASREPGDTEGAASLSSASTYSTGGTGPTEIGPGTAPRRIFRSATKTTKANDADELFRAAYPKLAGWVRRLVDDDDTAHEIASEAFVRLLSRWARVENPQSYLYMIATNLVRDHWRKTERERRAIRSVTAGAEQDAVTHPGQDVDVRNLIEGLPAKLRDPFLLHYYAGFAIREVATLLHRPEGTIKADLFAARAKLKTALGDRDAR